MKISPRVSDQCAAWLQASFPSKTAGAEYVLEATHGLYRATLSRDLHGLFAASELYLIVDVVNGLWLTPGIAGQQIQASVEDAIRLDGLDAKWEVDGAGLVAKLSALSTWQAVCLEIWTKGFWSQTGKSLSDYVASLAPLEREHV